MNTMERENSERSEIRAKLDSAIQRAKEACEHLEEKTVAAARAADTAVRKHPYQSAGIAFGLGLLIGALVMRSRRD